MARYRVKDWSVHFEKNRTRELKRMEWVAVPNRMDGRGYTALVDHPNGASHLGAWLAILEIASRSTKRGDIPQDGATNTETCLARISRLPVQIFMEVIPRLVDIGWIECFHIDGVSPHVPAEIPHPTAESAHYREGNGREGYNTTEQDFGGRFETAWRRHRKNRGTETMQLVAQILIGAGVRWEVFDEQHLPFCAYWDRQDWSKCPVTMLEWWRNGMPGPPPETSNGRKKSKTDEILEELRRAE